MKKYISLALCVVLSILFCSCGIVIERVPESAPVMVRSTEKPVETQAPTLAQNYQEYKINKLICDFSDGVAWADYSLSKYRGYGLINIKGEILFTFVSGDYDDYELYPSVDGLAAYSCDKGVYLIDTSGKVVLSYENDENNEYQLAAMGGGAIMLFKHIKNFSADEFRVFAVNYKGEPLTEEVKAELKATKLVYERDGKSTTDIDEPYELKYVSEWKYLKDGIFYCGNPNVYYDEVRLTVFNVNTGKLFMAPVILIDGGWGGHEFYFSMYPFKILDDGSILSLSGMVYSDKILDSEDSVINYLKNDQKRLYCWTNQFNIDNSNNKFGENKYFVSKFDFYYHYYSQFYAEVFGGTCPELDDIKEGYYDLNGKFVTALPTFAEGTEIIDYTCFSGKYAFILVKGVDNRHYATMIDESGKTLFEPVMIKLISEYEVAESFYMGFFKCEDGYLDKEGKIVAFESLPEEVKAYYDPESVAEPKPQTVTPTANTHFPAGSKAADSVFRQKEDK